MKFQNFTSALFGQVIEGIESSFGKLIASEVSYFESTLQNAYRGAVSNY